MTASAGIGETVSHHRTAEDAGRYCILPGDPPCTIAALFEDAKQVARNREYNVWTVSHGEKVTACSTGIGGPSAAIAMEELPQVVPTPIRTGTWWRHHRPDVQSGDIVVGQPGPSGPSTPAEYAPMEFPAAGLPGSPTAWPGLPRFGAAAAHRHRPVQGYFTASTPGRLPGLLSELKQKWRAWKRLGVKASEMESGGGGCSWWRRLWAAAAAPASMWCGTRSGGRLV